MSFVLVIGIISCPRNASLTKVVGTKDNPLYQVEFGTSKSGGDGVAKVSIILSRLAFVINRQVPRGRAAYESIHHTQRFGYRRGSSMGE